MNWLTRKWEWCIAPLTGADGRLSWSKLVTAAVLGLYGLKAPVPASVGIVAIAAAHGTKVLLAALTRSTPDDPDANV